MACKAVHAPAPGFRREAGPRFPGAVDPVAAGARGASPALGSAGLAASAQGLARPAMQAHSGWNKAQLACLPKRQGRPHAPAHGLSHLQFVSWNWRRLGLKDEGEPVIWGRDSGVPGSWQTAGPCREARRPHELSDSLSAATRPENSPPSRPSFRLPDSHTSPMPTKVCNQPRREATRKVLRPAALASYKASSARASSLAALISPPS